MANELNIANELSNIKEIYDFEFLCNYKNNTDNKDNTDDDDYMIDYDTYRMELLKIFKLDEYTDKITDTQTKLYELFKDNNDIKEIIYSIKTKHIFINTLTDDLVFTFLWSYDYFSDTQVLLNYYYLNNSFNEEHINNLKNIII
tara:strand:- start:103 stop:534 length:432 start_codon:yes stop_codon:yes gene_type:complete